jgi:hypothetical protein
MVLSVISQRTYPSAGDIDDCWVVATVWAAASSKPTIVRPTVTTFRKFANNPDRPGPTGGNIWDCDRGADGCWPKLSNTLLIERDWPTIYRYLHGGMPASVGVLSRSLPGHLRFNFYGTHQVGVHYQGRNLYCMNPLAPDDSTPGTITWEQLKKAMFDLIPGASQPYRALVFPKPSNTTQWGWEVPEDIQDAYAASSVAAKLRAVGVTTWGSRINLVDLEAGLEARKMTYGTSVQLVDVQKFMRPGTGPA